MTFAGVTLQPGASAVICSLTNVDTDAYIFGTHNVSCYNPVAWCSSWDGTIRFKDDAGVLLGTNPYFSMWYDTNHVASSYLNQGKRAQVVVSFQNRNTFNPISVDGSCKWLPGNPGATEVDVSPAGAITGAIVGSVLAAFCCLLICATPIIIIILVCVGCITLPASLAATAATIGIKNRREDVNINFHGSASPTTNYNTVV
jgi:hypothetical protein